MSLAAEREQWPPDYSREFAKRLKRLQVLRANPAYAAAYYADPARAGEFIEHWVFTYDPRLAGGELPAKLPFVPFQRQRELVQFLLACLHGQVPGLIEKSRDMGATWICCAVSVWLWRFVEGSAVGWGSRKEQLVDKIGDPDSIFEKIRMIVSLLPAELLPPGYKPDLHSSYMKLVNPANGATITGEAGDNIGRGGRKLIYFKDESAHYQRPELIEAALADNTRVQIDISSVNGTGNVFHRRREAGVEWRPGAQMQRRVANVFIMDWRDHPGKTQDWYDEREAKAKNDGLSHVFAQEVDRNYAAALDGVMIQPKWIKAAIDAHVNPAIKLAVGSKWDYGTLVAGLDVADGGLDRNAIGGIKGSIIKFAKEWGDRDTGVTTRNAIGALEGLGLVELQYDSIGVGAGVKAEANRLKDDNKVPQGISFTPWNAGAAPLWPDEHLIKDDTRSPKNGDFFKNIKAQGWWWLARRFENTYRALTEGLVFAAEQMISIPSDLPLLRQIEKELAQPTAGKSTDLRLLVNKTPDGTKSPNVGDAIMMASWPMVVFETPTAESGVWVMGDDYDG